MTRFLSTIRAMEPGDPRQIHLVYSAWQEWEVNCRCIALPVIPDSPDWKPDVGFGSGYENRRAAAEFDGLRDAVADLGAGAARALRELPGNIAWLRRLARLRDREAAGTLTEAEAAELAEMIATRDGIVAEWEAEVRKGPEGWAGDAAALLDYAVALRWRPILLDEAHRRGLATEAQVLEAHRERAYFETLVLAGFAGGALLSRMMLRRRGRDDLDEDSFLAEETARLTRGPADPDWPVIENPGIVWGGPIREQGGPFEAFLDRSDDLGDWIERSSRNYPTFDFFDREGGVATSAKTLNTNAVSYVDRPTRIFSRLTGVVDGMNAFENGGRRQYRLHSNMISETRLVLAVPQDANVDQIIQLQRAIEYADDNGVTLEMRFIR